MHDTSPRDDLVGGYVSTGKLSTQSESISLTRPWVLVVASTLLTVALGLIALTGTNWWMPIDEANYFITTVAAAIAALNVLFTMWLLRTAQHQLHDARQDAKDTLDAMREQERSLQGQLEQAKPSHLAERIEAH